MLVDESGFDHLLRDRQQKEAVDAYVCQLGLPTLSLHYEDLLRARARSGAEPGLCLSGVSGLALDGRPIRNTSDDLREAIVNFDASRAADQATLQEPMFDEQVHVPGEHPKTPEWCEPSV